MTELARTFARARNTILADLVGAAALVVMLVASLHLPMFA